MEGTKEFSSQVILPLSLRTAILEIFHDNLLIGGHLSAEKVLHKVGD